MKLGEMFTTSGIADCDNRFGGVPFEGLYFQRKTDAVKHTKKLYAKDSPLQHAGTEFLHHSDDAEKLEEPAKDAIEGVKKETKKPFKPKLDQGGKYKQLLKRLKKLHNI